MSARWATAVGILVLVCLVAPPCAASDRATAPAGASFQTKDELKPDTPSSQLDLDGRPGVKDLAIGERERGPISLPPSPIVIRPTPMLPGTSSVLGLGRGMGSVGQIGSGVPLDGSAAVAERSVKQLIRRLG